MENYAIERILNIVHFMEKSLIEIDLEKQLIKMEEKLKKKLNQKRTYFQMIKMELTIKNYYNNGKKIILLLQIKFSKIKSK